MDWTGIITKTAPATEPVTVTELKDFLRLSGTSDDVLLGGLITAARAAVEKITGRTFITTVYQLYFDVFPLCIELARPPVQSISSITYIDEDGVLQTLLSSEYVVDVASLYGRIVPAYDEEWPDTQGIINAVCVEYKAGYGDAAASVPAPLKEAIKMLASDIYEHPEANVELSLSENKSMSFLLDAYKIPGVA